MSAKPRPDGAANFSAPSRHQPSPMGLTAWLLPTAMLATATPAQAHLMNSGFGAFYDGLAHPLISPEDLLPAVAMALLAGLSGIRHGRFVLAALPSAWLAGMAVGAGMAAEWAIGLPVVPAWLNAGVTVLLGALVASDRRLPPAAVITLASALGALRGFDNGLGLAATTGGILAIAGIGCSLFAVVSLLAGQVAVLRAQWARLAVRISGSWIAAVGLLMLGWSVRS
jgi:urease accessory protein